MLTLDKNVNAEELTNKQLEAIKTRAIFLWGEKFWLAKLATAYEKANGYEPKSKDAIVRRWFNGVSNPTLESFNGLLLAVGCQMAIECPETVIKAQRIL